MDTNVLDGVCRIVSHTCTLRAAIQQANFNATFGESNTITLPAATFPVAITGRGEDGAATGDLDINGSLTIRGAGADATVIDGLGSDRVFDIMSGANVTLSNYLKPYLVLGLAEDRQDRLVLRRAGRDG